MPRPKSSSTVGHWGYRALCELEKELKAGIPTPTLDQDTPCANQDPKEHPQGMLDAAMEWCKVLTWHELRAEIEKHRELTREADINWAQHVLPVRLAEKRQKVKVTGRKSPHLSAKQCRTLSVALFNLERCIVALDLQWHIPDDDFAFEMQKASDVPSVQALADGAGGARGTAIRKLLEVADTDTVAGRALLKFYTIPQCRDLIGVEEPQLSDPSEPLILLDFSAIRWCGMTYELGRSIHKRMILLFLLKLKADSGEDTFDWRFAQGEVEAKYPKHPLESTRLRNDIFKNHENTFDAFFEAVNPSTNQWRLKLPVPSGFRFNDDWLR